jgi:AcrR family transcriptional regulator
MSTKQRILDASLALLNEEGEAQVSAVDIANVLDISPGNLYYHYKGKDEIIPALFDQFEEEMQIILGSGPEDIHSIEDQWIFAYIVLEEIWDFRFFYRNLVSIIQQFPSLSGRFRRLLVQMRKALRQNLTRLGKAGVLHIEGILLDTLVDQMVLTYTYWLNLQQLENQSPSSKTAIHRTVFQIMAMCVPYMGGSGFAALQSMTQLLEENTSTK